MNEELKVRIDNLYDGTMEVIEGFYSRYDEPEIEDNIYKAVINRIKFLDPTILQEVCPDIKLQEIQEGVSIKIFYHRIH